MFIIDQLRNRSEAAPGLVADTPTLSNDKVVLKVLTQADATSFFQLYACEKPHQQLRPCPLMPDDTAESFALRTAAACELIWTIRLVNTPTQIIGDCALHHWEKDKDILEFGGTLLPIFWGQGIMRAAFQSVAQHSVETYNARSLACTTTTQNNQANRFAEKMGFSPITIRDNTIRWEKAIC